VVATSTRIQQLETIIALTIVSWIDQSAAAAGRFAP
jgi:hypothetical protein